MLLLCPAVAAFALLSANPDDSTVARAASDAALDRQVVALNHQIAAIDAHLVEASPGYPAYAIALMSVGFGGMAGVGIAALRGADRGAFSDPRVTLSALGGGLLVGITGIVIGAVVSQRHREWFVELMGQRNELTARRAELRQQLRW